MEDAVSSNIGAAIEAGKQIGSIREMNASNGDVHALLPDGFSFERFPALNPVLPNHVRQSAKVIERGSFVEYVNRFKQDSTIINAYPETGRMEAIINYHGASGDKGNATADHGSHRCEFACGFDPNWQRWRDVDRKDMSQEAFAYFVEEMLHTIAKPDGADLLEMAQTLKVNRGVVFKANKRLKDGTVDIEFSEKDETQTSSGHFAVPDEITIACPIYMLREPQATVAKLRYRVEKGSPLSFRIDILNRKIIELDAFQVLADEVREATGQPVYLAG